VAIVITVLIYVCALTALAVYAWRLGDVGIKVIMDLLLFALSGVVALMVFFIKGSIPQVAQVLNDAAQDGAGGAGDED